jgi:Tol biopolymer transport system component
MDPTSRYGVIFRANARQSPAWTLPVSEGLWRFDLADRSLTLIAERATPTGAAVSTDQKFFFYLDPEREDRMSLMRLELATLRAERTPFSLNPQTDAPSGLGSVTPDGRTYVLAVKRGPRQFAALRIDLATGEQAVLWEAGPDHCNMHLQIAPGAGRDLMVQHNRGAVIDETGKLAKMVGPEGATLYLTDLDGGNRRPLPVGKPHTWAIQGHQAWLGATGEILFTTVWIDESGTRVEEEGRRQGVLRGIRPGEERSRVVARGHLFIHPSPSRDGRFFVAEVQQPARVIVAGSARTGKTRILCDTGAARLDMYGCPIPYFSPDCRWVIFNSDRTGTPQVYAATVPDGLLEDLDGR